MKYIVSLIVIFLVAAFFSSCGQSRDNYEIRKLQRDLSKAISNKYQIVTTADCVSMPSGVLRGFGFNFDCYHPLNDDEAVEMLIGAAEIVVEAINRNEFLLSITESGEFGINNVEVAIFLNDKNKFGNLYPDLSIVSMKSGIVTFYKIKEDEKGDKSMGSIEQIPLNQLLSQ